jgi:hypothetical protein
VGTFSTFGNLLSQDGSLVAFQASYGPRSGIFAGSGGPLLTIVQAGDPAPTGTFDSFDSVSVSEGKVAFSARYGFSSLSGIFMSNGGALTTIVKAGDAAPSGTFTSISLNAPSMVGGRIAFAGADGGGQGIFVRENGAISYLIHTGDELFGSPVTNLYFSPLSLDDTGTGTIGFGYILQNGKRGIALAMFVPEPTTAAISVLALPFLFARVRRIT